MAKRVISFDLSEAGITKAISEINRFKGDFLRTCNEVIQELQLQGVIHGKANIAAWGAVYTGELGNSMKGYFDASRRTGIVYNDAYYAVFVEFGTGIVGEGEPHPAAPPGWKYDYNEHGEAGWFYKNDRDGHVYWTQGMPSRPFMYDTFRELKQIAPDVVRKHFGNFQ